MTNISSSHCRQFGIGVISWRNFNNVSRDNMQAVKSTNDSPQLASRPASCFGSAGSGRESRVDRVNLREESLIRRLKSERERNVFTSIER